MTDLDAPAADPWPDLDGTPIAAPDPVGLREAAQAVFDGGVFDYTFTPEQQILIDALRAALHPEAGT